MRGWWCGTGGYIGVVGCFFRTIDMKHLGRQRDVSCLKNPCGQKEDSKMAMFTRSRVYGLGSSKKIKSVVLGLILLLVNFFTPEVPWKVGNE